MPERIQVLHGISAAMLRILELDLLLPEIARSACALETADAASVLIADPDADAMRIVAQQGLSEEYAAAQRIPLERAQAMYRGFDTPVEIDLRADPAGSASLVAREGLARVLAMPLVQEGALIGALNIYTRDPARRFDEVDVEVLHVLAAQASIAITNARLYAQERQARRLQESLLESLGDGVVIGLPDGTLRYNRVAREMLGVDADTAPRVDDFREGVELRREEDGSRIEPKDSPMARALRGERTNDVFTRLDPGRGTHHTLRLVAEPVRGPGGAVVAGVLSLHDLTAEREAGRQKDEFLSIVSHELKTPLTPLKALAQLLRLRLKRHRESGRPLDLDSLETNLRTIERQVDRMSGLVNDLLEVSRAGQGRFELQPTDFDLAALARDIVSRHGELVDDERRHEFVVDAPPTLVVHGDAIRTEQAITNLVGNAVKYSPRGGEVRVAVEPSDGEVAVAVSDQGIGIAAEDLPGLAQPFARGSRRARTFSGMGIGLYLARLIAERHGGRLELRSEGEDQGTTVTFVIPRGTEG